MKRITCTLLGAISLLAVSAQSYTVDGKNSKLTWTGYSEVGGYSQSGTISISEGVLELVDGQIAQMEVIADVQSITSTEKDLEKHLKEKDFFFVKKYPSAQLRCIESTDGNGVFELTIRGITKRFILPVNLTVSDSSCTAQGKLTIDRTLFGIKYNSSSYFQDLGSYAIKNEFDLEYSLVFLLQE
jgi:polyisoprenoid-binding protein YceI